MNKSKSQSGLPSSENHNILNERTLLWVLFLLVIIIVVLIIMTMSVIFSREPLSPSILAPTITSSPLASGAGTTQLPEPTNTVTAALLKTLLPDITGTPTGEPESLSLTPLKPVCPIPERTISNSPPIRLKAYFRSGQTFLTWPERTDLNGELYKIYRSNCPITSQNLAQATMIAEVSKDSARFYSNRYNVNNSGNWQPRYSDRLIIQDNGDEIPAGTGLLVWTLSPANFAGQAKGQGYYAITVVIAGAEQSLDPSLSIGPINEAVDNPKPVEITHSPGVNPGPGGHVYIQYMDLRLWNGTFHAPNSTNKYYGLNPTDPNLANALQYAYDYTVYQPTLDNCHGKLPDKLPVTFWLHGWRSNSYWAPKKNDQGYCSYAIYPIDVTETWYFGFARNHDYRKPGDIQAGDVIENYTEQRVLQMLYDLELYPPGLPVDQQKVYVFGQSMGGSGALAFAERYPNVFAAAYASQPITNYLTAGITKQNWIADAAIKWGKPDLDLPIAITAPGNWAIPIQKYNGIGVWDWQNYQANLSGSVVKGRIADDMAPIGIIHGYKDHVVLFATQGQPTYQALNDGLRAWGGVVNGSDHLWQYFLGLPLSMIQLPQRAPFWNLGVIRDETIPGISNLSSNSPLPPQGNSSYNTTVKWSSSWDPWDGAPIDENSRWQMSFCSVASGSMDCGTGKDVTLDVTPRRLQHFKTNPMTLYDWKNIQISDGKVVAEGTTSSGAYGLITIRNLAVSTGGNRLLIEPHPAK